MGVGWLLCCVLMGWDRRGKHCFWMLFPLLSYLVRFKDEYFSKEGCCIVLGLLGLYGDV